MVKEIRPITGSTEMIDAAAEPTARSAGAEVFYTQAVRVLAWHGSRDRPMVRIRAALRGVRYADARYRPDGVDVVQSLRPAAASLRWPGYRTSHSQAARSDRLAASACLHGAALGGASGTSAQLPLGLSERARLRAALADGRTGRPPEDPVRTSSSAREDMSGTPVFAGRLCPGR